MQQTKQVIVMRSDLKGVTGNKVRSGKLIAQACHASMGFLMDQIKKDPMITGGYSTITPIELTLTQIEWICSDYRKVVLKVDSLRALLDISDLCAIMGLESHLITDAGYTEFLEPTITCLAIGPDYDEKIDEVTKGLKLF